MDEPRTIWDPLRRKEVTLTPEERVRQWLIAVLRDIAHVPVHMMNSEVEMTFGEAGKTYRADVLVFGKDGNPLAIAECKRPDVKITPAVLEQALRYDMVLRARYLILTNGSDTRVAMRSDAGITFCDKLPSYEEMTKQI